MLTLWLGKVPKHCCHNSSTETINLQLQKTNLPTALITKVVPSSGDSNNWLHSCRPKMLNSMGQSMDKDKAGLHLFGMKFTAIERKTNHKICDSVWRHLPTALITKAVQSLGDSNYQLHSCRHKILNSMRQSTNKDKARLCLFSMKFTAMERMTNHKRCDSVWRHLPTAIFVKAVLSSSHSNNQLHSCRPKMPSSMGQSTDKDKAGLHLFSMIFTAIERKTNWKRCNSVWRHLSAALITKAVLSSGDSNNWLQT
jgi:hypothetical protein